MVWRITPTRLYTEYEEFKTITKYRIVASDSTSVVIELTERTLNELGVIEFEGSLLQIHLEEKNSLSIISGYNQEFFIV